MAVLSKIREKTIILIGVIGLALFAFVVQGALDGNNGPKVDEVGEINGKTISKKEFSERLDAYKTNSGGRVSETQAMNVVWDGIVREEVYKNQLEEAGVVVGEKDVWESIISLPFFQNSPQFKNDAGLFDEEKVKEFIADMRDEAMASPNGSEERRRWANWLTSENQIRQNLVRSSYNNLVNAGLGATLEEGRRDYEFNNATVTAKYVYLPYSSIADSLITLKTSDYQNYINANAKKYEVDESRSMKYVTFDILPSDADKVALKANIAKFIEDDEKFGTKGMKNATDMVAFLDEAKSDLPSVDKFLFKNKLPKSEADKIMNAKVGDVVGPYEENGHYKISKVMEFKKMPDSVKSRHIIVPYLGSERSNSTRSKEAAKKTVDSIFRIVKNSTSKFIEMADKVNSDGTKGKGGEIGWVSYDAAFSPNFDEDFATFMFGNKKGAIDVVETKFGYHIIKVDDQKNFENTVKLATLSREILPSTETENKFYQDAEIFTSDVSKGGDFEELAKEKGYDVKMANKVTVLSERVPGLSGNNRQIVRWAFEDGNKIGAVKRFDVDKGYVVATLYAKTAEGLATVSDIAGQIKPLILKQKKAEMLNAKINGATLEDIAKANNTTVRTASKVNLTSPIISGVGREAAVVGAMSNAPENKIIKGVDGEKGVFAFSVTSKEAPTKLENYATFRNGLSSKVKSRGNQVFNALKEAADIEDNRANLY